MANRVAHGTSETDARLQVRESGYRQGTRAVVPEGKGQKIRIRLMGWEPGATVVEGSSADYPVERIIRDFPAAFPAGTRMRANHDSVCDAGGDIRRIMAKTISEPVAEADGMYADAIVREGEPTEFIRQFADVIGTSISAGVLVEETELLDSDGMPVLDEEGNAVMVPRRSERGAKIVDRFLSMQESPYNSIDFVEVPGADGAVVQLALESARRIVEHTVLREASGFAVDLVGKREKTPSRTTERSKPGVTSAQEKKENEMDEKAVEALLEAKLAPVVAFVNESKANKAAEAQATVNAEAVATAAKEAVGKFRESMKRIDDAELLEPIAESLIERAADGEDITDATIAEAKEQSSRLLEAAKSALGDNHSGASERFAVHSTDSDVDFTVPGWSA